jgi:hypothetical protein
MPYYSMDERSLDVWSGQMYQILVGIGLVILFLIFGPPVIPDGQFPKKWLGLDVVSWYWIAILVPILHQIIIAPLWKLELSSQRLTNFFGSTDRAFTFFRVVFALFFVPRLFIAIPISWLTRETLDQASGAVFFVLALVLTPIVIFGWYSVIRYFGIPRAFGADHFYPEYRKLPMVNKGIYKYTSNAMYVFVLAIVWVPAAYMGSLPGLLVGVFNHAWVWVHYYFIEQPDMDYIYG